MRHQLPPGKVDLCEVLHALVERVGSVDRTVATRLLLLSAPRSFVPFGKVKSTLFEMMLLAPEGSQVLDETPLRLVLNDRMTTADADLLADAVLQAFRMRCPSARRPFGLREEHEEGVLEMSSAIFWHVVNLMFCQMQGMEGMRPEFLDDSAARQLVEMRELSRITLYFLHQMYTGDPVPAGAEPPQEFILETAVDWMGQVPWQRVAPDWDGVRAEFRGWRPRDEWGILRRGW